MVKRQGDLGGIKFCNRVREALYEKTQGVMASKGKKAHVGSSQKSEQFATGYKVHDHVEVCCILKAPPQIDYERILYSEKHFLLVVRVIDLLGLDDLFLL